MFAVPLTSPWWSTVFRTELSGTAEDEGEGSKPAAGSAPTDLPEAPGSTLKSSLFTRLPDKPGLVQVEREIPYARGIVPQIHAAVAELALPSVEGPALLPAGTRVLDVAYTKGGTVYVDFSPEIEAARGVGADEEKQLLQAIVLTIVENFAAARRVVILVDGKAPKPGHFDLSRPLRRDDPIFAGEPETDPDSTSSPLNTSPRKGQSPLP